MALVKVKWGPRPARWVAEEDPGSEYSPPAAVAARMMVKGLLEEIRYEDGSFTGRYRLTDAGFRKARGSVHAV